MKRRIIALALCAMLALSACFASACTGGINAPITPPPATDAPTNAPAETTEAPIEQQTGLTVKNGLASCIDSFYISPVTSEEWGEAVAELIPSGESIKLDFADFNGEPGYVYDVGAVDENGLNYDVWNVELADGDVLLLTADPAEELGSLAVTHADGSVTEYEAEVYSDDDPPEEKAVTVLNPCTELISDYTYDDDLGVALGYFSMDLVVLDEYEAENYPGLSAAVDDMNAAERGNAEAIYRELVSESRETYADDPENYVAPEFRVKAFFRRVDTRVFSVLFERDVKYGSYSHWTYSSYNISTMTGEKLTLAGIVSDPSELPSLINEQMEGRNEDGFMLDENTDYSDYFSVWSSPDLAWTLDPHGVGMVFNNNAFGIDDAYTSTILIPFSEHPDLVAAELTACPRSYSVAFPWGLSTYFEVGGKVSPLFVTGYASDDGWSFERIGVYFDEDSIMEENNEALDLAPLYIHVNGCDYLYVEATCMNDYQMIYAYDLSDGAVTKCGEVHAGWYNYYVDAEDDEDYHFYTQPMPDPESFLLTSRTDVLSTVDGYKLYSIGENGLPESENEWFRLDRQLVFTLLRDLEVTNADGSKETVKAGEKVIYVATDDERTAVLCQAETPEWYVTVNTLDGVGPAIDGVSIFDIFEGLEFAG
ncbi:MAG: hypothetical protein IIT70_03695 [Clostridia bacterium]|nr:hypothetical protein [Clostridia bacterium]